MQPNLNLPPLHDVHSPMSSLGAVLGQMGQTLIDRVRASDHCGSPILSLATRARTIALYVRLWHFGRTFQRLLRLAMAGKLSVRARHTDKTTDGAVQEPVGQEFAGQESRARDEAGTEAGDRKPAAPGYDPASMFYEQVPHGCHEGSPIRPTPPTRGFGWMLGYLPVRTRDAIATVLPATYVRAMIETYPQVARLMRPLLRALGVALPEWFPAAPKYARKSRARPKSEHKPRRPPLRSPNFVPSERQMRDWGIVMSPDQRHKRDRAERARADAARASGLNPEAGRFYAGAGGGAGAGDSGIPAAGGRGAKS